jgi:predicted ATPase
VGRRSPTSATCPSPKRPARGLEEQRAAAVELAAEVATRLGDPGAELDEVHTLLAAEPPRESAAVALARGLSASGRQVEALAVLDRTRDRLADELGLDPGAELASTRLAVLRGTPSPRTSPPALLTSFVGRDADLRRVTALLGTARLMTLTGPGGAGKTRLAREVARALPGEVRIAELAPLGGVDGLAAAVLAAVGSPTSVARGVEETGTESRLLAALAGRDLLLVLDNCEHLVDGAARLAQTLLEHTPGLRVLATSREALGVPGEVLHPVGALTDGDAMRLFVDRGAAVRPG